MLGETASGRIRYFQFLAGDDQVGIPDLIFIRFIDHFPFLSISVLLQSDVPEAVSGNNSIGL